MRLEAIDHYAETINRKEHDMVKLWTTMPELRYMKRWFRGIRGLDFEVSLDPSYRIPQLYYDEKSYAVSSDSIESRRDFIFDRVHLILLRIYRDPAFMSSQEYRDLKDQLMILKLST